MDRSDVWRRRSNVLSKQLTWGQFCEEILHSFSASSTYDLVDRFNAFKQNNLSISEYTDQFEYLMAEVQEENPNLTEMWFVKCYVNGMRATIKFQLGPLRPETLTDAYWLAVDIEQATPAKKPYPVVTAGHNKHYFQYNKPQNNLPDEGGEFKQPAVIQKAREPGKCWRCGDVWFHGHK